VLSAGCFLRNLRRRLSLHKLVGQIAISRPLIGAVGFGYIEMTASIGVSKATPDAPAALSTETRLPKTAKETARLVVGMIATAPYFFDESSTTCFLNSPAMTFDGCASII